MLLPQDPHSGALSLSLLTQHSWDISGGEGLGWEFLREVRLEPGRERSSTWGSGLSKGPWVKCCGLRRLSMDGSIQTRGAGIWWALRVSLKGACAVDPGLQQDCWSQGGWSSSGGAHRTGWCEFKDLQAACSPQRCCGSNRMEME